MNKSKVFKIANLLRSKYKLTLSEALIISWKNEKLRNRMKEEAVFFNFKKKDGSIREAYGTLHNIEHLLVGSDKFQNDIFTSRYFDLEAKEFRAYKIINLQ